MTIYTLQTQLSLGLQAAILTVHTLQTQLSLGLQAAIIPSKLVLVQS